MRGGSRTRVMSLNNGVLGNHPVRMRRGNRMRLRKRKSEDEDSLGGSDVGGGQGG